MPMLLRGRAGPQAAQHRDKRRTERRKTTDRDLPPPQFWDNLSHIPLVKRALRELDRRNNRLQSREQGLESSRPSPGDPRQLEGDIEYQAIKRFSRTGGPDLSDLRGVCCLICYFTHLGAFTTSLLCLNCPCRHLSPQSSPSNRRLSMHTAPQSHHRRVNTWADVVVVRICPDAARPTAAAHLCPVSESAGATLSAIPQSRRTNQEREAAATPANPGQEAEVGWPASGTSP